MKLNVVAVPLTTAPHADDRELAGVYLVEGISDTLAPGDAADTALASFHARQGVKVLDDFDFFVLDPESKSLLAPAHGDDRDEFECVKVADEPEDWMWDLMGAPAVRPARQTTPTGDSHHDHPHGSRP